VEQEGLFQLLAHQLFTLVVAVVQLDMEFLLEQVEMVAEVRQVQHLWEPLVVKILVAVEVEVAVSLVFLVLLEARELLY
jgi:hypothetical protein